MPRPLDVLLGRLAVDQGLLTSAQLDAALRVQAVEVPPPPLGVVLVESHFLTHAQVGDLLRAQAEFAAGASAWRFCVLAVQHCHATPAQVNSALREQGRREESGESGLLLGEILVAQGALTPEGVKEVLRRQFESPTLSGPALTICASDATRTGAGGDPTASPSRSFLHYELVAELGRGGAGVVYKAFHPGLNTYFAVKVLLAGDHASQEDVKRFYREAQSAARLKHPGIVAVHDVGEHDGKTWFAMEYVEGAGLDKVIADPAKFGIAPAAGGGATPGVCKSAALRMTQEIADAVQSAHEAGIVHRDLKPANVLRDASGRLKVADFGLAKVVETAGATGATRSGTVMGTPAYMSPEQVAGDVREVDAQSDVYQVGAILYELLTGRPPYAGGTAIALLMQVEGADLVPPRRRNPRIDRDAETICLKAMAREKVKRYASARELAEDCARALAGEAIRARPEAWWEHAARWSRRRKAVVGLGTALALALTIAGATKWDIERSRREQERLQRDVLDKASQAVLDYQDTVLNVRLDADGRRALAKQPLATLEMLLEHQSDFGPLYSWRGMTKDLIGDSPQILAEAEADLDRGCALSPERAVVWYLRGMHHLEIYGSLRSLPGVTFSGSEVNFEPPLPETAEDRHRREQGLADIARMVGEAKHDPAFGDEEARIGKAVAALYRGGDAECRQVLDLLEGIERPKARRLKGRACYYLKRFDEAAAALSGALKAWPEDALAWNSLGLAEHAAGLRSAARGADSRERCGKAIAAFGEALRRNPEMAGAYLCRGVAYQSLGEAEAACGLDPRVTYGKSVEDFGEALRCMPGYANAYLNRGVVYQSLGEAEMARGLDPRETYGKAMADYDGVLQRNPQDEVAYINRGNVYLHLGDAEEARGLDPRVLYGKAVKDFGEALRRNPEDAVAYFNRGNVLGRLGEAEAARGLDPRATYVKALADCGDALRRNPEYADAYLNRGNFYVNLGEAEATRRLDPREAYGNAMVDFGEALRRNPEHAAAYNSRGKLHVCQGEAEATRGLDPQESYSKAEADYRAALAHHYPLANLNLGLLYRTQRRFDEAVTAFEAGAQAVPAYAAWAQARIDETRVMRRPAPADPWAREFALAEQAVPTGDYPGARTRYEHGLALVDQALGSLSDAERAARLADSRLRAVLANAHYNLACIDSLASAGKDAPNASSKPVDPAEAAHLQDQAFAHLAAALDFGFADAAHLAVDTDLAPLHDDVRWTQLIARLQQPPK